ncbi:MAG: serine hydrolase [Caldilineales bacterium]
MLPVDRTSVIARLMSGIFIASLVTACAAPPAAPVAPTATLIPPMPPSNPTAVVQAWIEAINSSDIDAALALMTQDAKFQGVFTDPPPNVLGWFIGGTFNYGVPDCQPQGDQLACTFPFNDDGCIAAHGADDLTAKMVFAFQDGKIHRVTVMEGSGNWVGYNGWLGEMFAWANANHADELAQIDFQHQTKGADIVVKLCQEYAAAPKLDNATVAQIDAMVQDMMERNKLPGFALGVVKDGELVYAKGFGVANLDSGEPVTPETVFQWAETSMVPTAMAVLQLVDAGKVNLNAPVTDYVPYFQLADERYKDITVGQVLSYQSGIPDSGDTMADWENITPELDADALERWIREDLAQKELDFKPGSGFEGSDIGYALLGAVISAASGQPYEDYMEENILKPMGMDHSTFLLDEVDQSLLASPHVAQGGKVVVSDAMPYSRPFAAANNLFSSIDDMAKLAEVSLNHGSIGGQRLLPADVVDQMLEPRVATSYSTYPFGQEYPSHMMQDWGYGWFLGDVAGHKVASTVGGELGFHSCLAVAPDDNLAVFAVGNGPLTGGYYANDITTDVLGTLLEKQQSVSEAAEPANSLDDATITEIDAMVQEMMAENEIPGYALGVVEDGQIVYVKGFGVERVREDKPVTPHTVFGTGSIGKTATATAILQLAAEGKVDLDAPVTDYLPYFKLADERYKDITPRQLITNRSGLPGEPPDWYPLPVEYDDGALERYVRGLDSIKLLFAPDTRWSYSSIGYTVMADIVAKVSGQTFEDYLQENVLDPLGMNDTLLIVREADEEQVASPHIRNEAGEVAVSDIFPYRRQFAATGPLYSSITDLARFAAANLNRGEFEGARVLPSTTYDAMWEPISRTDFQPGPVLTPLSTNFGMGWVVGAMGDHRIVDMLGYDQGYGGALILAPDDDIAVVMATNYFDLNEFDLSTWETAANVLQLLLTEDQ